MNILILVLSYNEGVFADFMKAQQETWDSEKHPDVDVLYYCGGNKTAPLYHHFHFVSGELDMNVSDAYEMMHWKFKVALEHVEYERYDIIFRTNSCSYIDKEKIIEVAKTLPREKCYAGYHNGSYISGAGIFFSPDVLDILKAELTEAPHGAEDVLIGEILKDRISMVADNSRVDAAVEGVDMTNLSGNEYHFRFKTSNDLKDRPRDVMNMYKLHKELKG